MKDKLLHTGHKKLYYRMRFFLIGLFSLVALAGISATPIAITYSIAMANAAKAEASHAEKPAAEGPIVSELSSYQD